MSESLSIDRGKNRAMPVVTLVGEPEIARVLLSERIIPATIFAMATTGAALASDSPALSIDAEVRRKAREEGLRQRGTMAFGSAAHRFFPGLGYRREVVSEALSGQSTERSAKRGQATG